MDRRKILSLSAVAAAGLAAPLRTAVGQQKSIKVRIPTKPAMHSNLKPATCSDPKPAGVPT